MSFFRRYNSSHPSVTPAQSYSVGSNRLQHPSPQDWSGRTGSQQQFDGSKDRYGAPPPDRYGTSTFLTPQSSSQQCNRNPVSLYSRGSADIDADRAALFAGRNPDAPNRLLNDSTNFKIESRWDQRHQEGGNEEEDIEAIKTSIRETKQKSLASTRNALRIAREAEETGLNTLLSLEDQSERLGTSEAHIDMANYNSLKAADKVDELKQLNRSIFRPVIVFNKDKKRAAQETKIRAHHIEARAERKRNAIGAREAQERGGSVAPSYSGTGSGYSDDVYNQHDGSNGISTLSGVYRVQDRVRKEQRKHFQFEATASDDELEGELDDNLDSIAIVVANMKRLAIATCQEVERQNNGIDQITMKVNTTEQRVVANTNGMRKF